MKHLWSVLCTRGIIDKQSNNVSIFEILEEIHVPRSAVARETEPIVGVLANWVSSFSRTNNDIPETGKIRDVIKLPSGKSFGTRESDIDLKNVKRRRLIRAIPLPPKNEEGTYIFETSLKGEGENRWKKVSEIPLELILDDM